MMPNSDEKNGVSLTQIKQISKHPQNLNKLRASSQNKTATRVKTADKFSTPIKPRQMNQIKQVNNKKDE